MTRSAPWTFRLIAALWLLVSATGAWAGERFTDNGDGTVTDHKLGLMWAQSDNQGDIDWKQAEKWVRFTFPYSLKTYHHNWRLPTRAEVQSLYVRDKAYAGYQADCGMQVRIVPQIRLSCGWVWTAEQISISAWGFHFNRGNAFKDRMTLKKAYRALAVRNIE